MTVLGIYLTPTDPPAAFNWYSLAAQQGYVPAVARLGVMLCSSPVPGTPDLKKAVECFEFAIERGDVVAKASLGECYLTGKGVAKDRDRAIQLLREASDGGNAIAMNRLGDVLRAMGAEARSKNEPGAAFFTDAMQLFARAAESGNFDALGNLGVVYINGDGVPPDLKKAASLFEKGALAGNPYCMFLFAMCFEQGIGIPKNIPDAKSWYRKSAAGGNPQAQKWLRKNGIPLPAP
jgi:TPR repeat protein